VAVTTFETRADSWVATPLVGDPVVGRAADTTPLRAATLEAGEESTGWVEFELTADATDIFLYYLDASGEVAFIVALL
jgi:hypothetical protein